MEEPKPVLYISGLPDKTSPNEIRRALYLYCTQFGPVREVACKRSRKMYGQAFVVFDDVNTAAEALRELRDRQFYGRKIRAAYAHRNSFSIDSGERHRRDTERKKAAKMAAR